MSGVTWSGFATGAAANATPANPGATGVSLADIDNDGHLDLVVATTAAPLLYLNP